MKSAMATNTAEFVASYRSNIKEFFSSVYNEGKNPVSLLMELGSKLDIPVKFMETEQGGLSNNRVYICEARIGTFRCTGVQAYSKKEAKKNTAKKAIQILKSGVGVSVSQCTASSSEFNATGTPISPVERHLTVRTPEARNTQTNTNIAGSSPGALIGKLQELAVNNHWKAPEYSLVHEAGQSHDKTFVIECKVNDYISQGLGKNKKTAKHIAAQNMLSLLEEVNKSRVESPSSSRSVSPEISFGANHLMSANQAVSVDASPLSKPGKPDFLASYLYTDAMEDSSDDEYEIDLDKIRFSGTSSPDYSAPDDDTFCRSLQERADKYDLNVDYKDLREKSFTGKFQCFVKLSTDPVAVLCGSGNTRGAAHAQAAHNALQYLDVMIAS